MFRAFLSWLKRILLVVRRFFKSTQTLDGVESRQHAPPAPSRRATADIDPSIPTTPPSLKFSALAHESSAQSIQSKPSPTDSLSASTAQEDVWTGENGPELPRSYQTTTLQAMPCDARRVFLYWEIADADLKAMADEEGPIFQRESIAVLRVYSWGTLGKEIPVDIGKGCLYLTLTRGGSYDFELVFKHSFSRSRVLAHSNAVTLPTDHSSRRLNGEAASSPHPSGGKNGFDAFSGVSPKKWVNGSGAA